MMCDERQPLIDHRAAVLFDGRAMLYIITTQTTLNAPQHTERTVFSSCMMGRYGCGMSSLLSTCPGLGSELQAADSSSTQGGK